MYARRCVLARGNWKRTGGSIDLFSFIAQLVGALAWPITLLVIVLLVRKQLRDLLSSLFRMRFRGLELEFGQRLQEIEKSIEADEPPAGRIEEEPIEWQPERLAAVSPRAAIMNAWLGLETELRKLAGVEDSSRLSSSRLTRDLIKEEVISSSTASALGQLRDLRNQAVHAPDFTLSPQAAIEYAELARAIRALIAKPST